MRKRKRLLREKRSESDDDDSESEDEAPDIGEEYEEVEDEEIVLQASAWELVIDEKPTNERHRILGGSKSLPKIFICKAHSVQVCYPCATSVNNENAELDQARLSE